MRRYRYSSSVSREMDKLQREIKGTAEDAIAQLKNISSVFERILWKKNISSEDLLERIKIVEDLLEQFEGGPIEDLRRHAYGLEPLEF